MEEVITLLQELFEDNSIGVIGINNTHVADYYYCQSCSASKDIKGNANSFAPLEEIEHKDSCKIMKIKKLIMELKE